MQKSRRKPDIPAWAFIVAFAVAFGVFAIFGLGLSALWMIAWEWGIGVLLALSLLTVSCSNVSKRGFKILMAYVVVIFLAVMPAIAVNPIITYQSAAQSLTSSRELDYFRNVLGRSYNYTELIEWENAAISWNGSPDMIFYTDPIDIYQYGQARCGGYAILYAELCISQGYQSRIVVSIFGDHVWNEVRIGGEWIRVDASPTGAPMSENIGYRLFYEEKWHTPPLLALAFEGSSIMDVTGNYRSDGFSLLSGLTIMFVLIGAWFAFCIRLIWKGSSRPLLGLDE